MSDVIEMKKEEAPKRSLEDLKKECTKAYHQLGVLQYNSVIIKQQVEATYKLISDLNMEADSLPKVETKES